MGHPAALAASHAYCQRQAKAHAKSFYFASIALPREKKQAAYALYAFCRYVDDLVDRSASKDAVPVLLRQIGEQFDHMVTGGLSHPPFVPAFAWAVRRFAVEKQPFLDLLRGVSMDFGPVRIADWPGLRDYCYHVASVVGLMMARVFELRNEQGLSHAIDLGIAMQLTNILRDIKEDHLLDRVYLPADEMRGNSVTDVDLSADKVSPRMKVLLTQYIAKAREYYSRAELGIPMLADDGSQFTVWLMRHVYAGILDEIERADFEVLNRRVRTTFPRKLILAARAWRDYRKHRLLPS